MHNWYRFKSKSEEKLERILFISDGHSGITHWLINGHRPHGSPAPYLLIKKLMQERVIYILFPSFRKPNIKLHDNLNLYVIYKPKSKSKYLLKLFERIFQMVEGFIVGLKICLINKPQIIYSSGYMSIIAGMLGRIFKVNVVSRIYGTFLYEKLLSKGIKSLFSALPEMLVFKSWVDALIITNDGTRGDKVAEQLRIPREKVYFWINGVDKELLRNLAGQRLEIRNALKIDSSTIVISSIGRLAKWKRVDLAIRVYAELAQKNTDISMVLLIIGSGREQNRLEELVYRLGLEQSVRLIGSVDHQTALKYMVASDILLFFYEHSNVGNALLEALSLGKPVICRDTGDTASFVKHDFNGLLVPNDSAEYIVSIGGKYLSELVYNSEKRGRLSQNAFAFAENKIPEWNERIEREINLIKTLAL